MSKEDEKQNYFCIYCFTKAEDKNQLYCNCCYYNGHNRWTSRKDRFPRSDSATSFNCPTCSRVLSTDIIYSDDTHCPHCKNELEWCNKCQGMGFETSDKGRELQSKNGKTLLNPVYYKKMQKRYWIASLIFSSILLGIVFFQNSWNWKTSVVTSLVFLGLINFLIYRKFLTLPNRDGLKTGCKDCAGSDGDQEENRGVGLN